MGKNQRVRATKNTELQQVYTTGRKKTATANAVVQRGTGTITLNNRPIHLVEPKTLRIKIFEPLLLVGASQFKNLQIRIKTVGGGTIAQLLAARQAVAKALVAWKQKYEDEDSKQTVRRTFMSFDKNLLVSDMRRKEPKKYGGKSARARKQKSYR